MTLESDRMFHAFITDVLNNATVVTYMDSNVTITAYIPICIFLFPLFSFLFFVNF